MPKAIPTAAPQIALRQTEASEIASEASGVAVITYGLSAFFDGNGVFRRAFEFTDYGFLPSLLGSAVTVPFSIGYLDAISVPKMSVNEFAANPEILPKNYSEPDSTRICILRPPPEPRRDGVEPFDLEFCRQESKKHKDERCFHLCCDSNCDLRQLPAPFSNESALRARVGLLGFHYTVKKFRLV
ncbi:Yip1 family protein [Archaeoglobus sp.]